MSIKTALISVSDKAGIKELGEGLVKAGFRILSTGGTLKYLKENGVEVTKVSEYTGSPEILDGRVKTLHPKIHGGILARRDLKDHQKQLQEHNIDPIDIVVVNLYPFVETIAKEGVTLEEAIENIDIGGPTMLRAAAKNHAHVTVITDPADYSIVLSQLQEQGATTLEFRQKLAAKTFKHTAQYDAAIDNYLEKVFG